MLRHPSQSIPQRGKDGIKLFIASDSVLCLRDGASGPGCNQLFRQRFANNVGKAGGYDEVVFGIISSGNIDDIRIRIDKWITDYAGGIAEDFHHHVIVVTMINDIIHPKVKKKLKRPPSIDPATYTHLDDFIALTKKIPNLLITGPGDERLWQEPGFDNPAKEFYRELAKNGHTQCGALAVWRTLAKRGSYHFSATIENQKAICGLLHDLA